MSKTTIAGIEEKLTSDAITALAKALTEATAGYAKAFVPYLGHATENNREFEIRVKAFNEAFAKIVAETVSLRLAYACGYSPRLDADGPERVAAVLRKELPPDIIAAIRSVACEAFLAKVDEIGSIAEGAAQMAQEADNR